MIASDQVRPSLTVELRRQAELAPDAPALLDVLGGGLTRAELGRRTQALGAAVRRAGAGPADRVAIVCPNGVTAAVAFLAVSAVAVACPVNPDLPEAEVHRLLVDLGARVLVVAGPDPGPARAAAGRCGVPVVVGDGPLPAGAVIPPPGPDRVALVLPTSGTTARPKLVPLTHHNLAHAVANVGAVLGLGADDRCLNVMPLFHIHGLVAGLAASLAAGGSVICAPGFDPGRFGSWLDALRPSWYSAVPTIHQAVTGLYVEPTHTTLRLIRSSSAPLPPTVLEALEQTFAVPVLEAYGMSEATHQIASNPLPPGVRKPGSVGLPTGVRVGVLDADGRELPLGALGEVAIAGPTVTGGYLDAPAANAAAFTAGWLRTGDQGRLDDDGYLFLAGRIKELINRGGEKISPREVEEGLLDHPAVARVAAFAVPHGTLGEEVGVAVVPRDGTQLHPAQLRDFARARLAHFKVPRHVVVVPALPTGPTGKVQRSTLAQVLGVPADPADVEPAGRPPMPGLESYLVGLVTGILGRPVGVEEDLLAAGLESMQAARVLTRLADLQGVTITVRDVFQQATIARLAVAVTAAQAGQVPADELAELLRSLPGSDRDADGA